MKNPISKFVVERKIAPKLTQKMGRTSLTLKKHSPHIFFGLGLGGVIGGTVMACRATLKLPQVLEEIEHDMEVVRELKKDGAEKNYPVEQVGRDITYVYVKSALKVGRLYGPAMLVGGLGLSALTGSHVTLTRRNTSLMAAYAAVTAAYDEYRQRIIEELGEDKELDIYQACDIAVAELSEIKEVVNPNKFSPYARIFDEQSSEFQKDPELNRLFIQCQQNYFTQKLQAYGHVFLNEVYDALGLERSKQGAIVGWIIGDDGDNFVDFGLFSNPNPEFINGVEPRTILDFNVDGVIFDKI